MALKLPRVEAHPTVQQAFNVVAQAFPVRWPNLAGTVSHVYNAADYGTFGTGAAIQAAIDEAAASSGAGGLVYIPSGDWTVNDGLTLPPAKVIILQGAGMPEGSGNANRYAPTRLVRSSGTTTMISAIGSGSDFCQFELRDLEVRGGGFAGIVCDVSQGGVYFSRVRFVGATHHLLRMKRVFNSSAHDVTFTAGGNGTSLPAVLFDAVTTTSQGGVDTFQLVNAQFEGNGGTDLKLTGDTTTGGPTTSLQLTNLKFEGGTAGAVACPYIDLEYSQNCLFTTTQLSVHGSRTVAPIKKHHLVGASRADKFVNLTIDNTDGSSFPYCVDHTLGALMLIGVTIIGNTGPTTAGVRVASSVASTDFDLIGLRANLAIDKALLDERSTPSVASAATITPPLNSRVFKVTGTADITAVTTAPAGTMVTLHFTGTAATNGVVDNGTTLNLAGNFAYTPNDTLTLSSDGTNWVEANRSVN